MTLSTSAARLLSWVPLLSIISGLIGVALGSYMTRSWQRKQWLLESTKAEYRELLSVLSHSAHYILNNSPMEALGGLSVKTGEQERLSHEAADRGHAVIADRIFIVDALSRGHIADRWTELVKQRQADRFWIAWKELHRKLQKMAREGLNLKD